MTDGRVSMVIDSMDHTCRFGVKAYYCTELGFYIASIGMLVFWEVRRRDFAAMMIHHIATVALIGGSYYLK